MDSLLEKLVELKSAGGTKTHEAIIDSQCVKSAHPSSQKGIGGGKKIKGIKRHIAVNGMSLPLAVNITKANVHDSRAASA